MNDEGSLIHDSGNEIRLWRILDLHFVGQYT